MKRDAEWLFYYVFFEYVNFLNKIQYPCLKFVKKMLIRPQKSGFFDKSGRKEGLKKENLAKEKTNRVEKILKIEK
ncbi:TPA: hypothetical protein QB352_000585 [Pasteurella multocida]|nr:hypothetical protein [Pasteurella multocida]